MFTKTAVALAAASLALGAAAASPAMANYDPCYENPAAKGCPGNYDVSRSTLLQARARSTKCIPPRPPRPAAITASGAGAI